MTDFREIEVQVTDEEIAHLTLAGFWKPDEDGVLRLTNDGSAWLREWCKKRLAETERPTNAGENPSND